jgi:hypothetical protein
LFTVNYGNSPVTPKMDQSGPQGIQKGSYSHRTCNVMSIQWCVPHAVIVDRAVDLHGTFLMQTTQQTSNTQSMFASVRFTSSSFLSVCRLPPSDLNLEINTMFMYTCISYIFILKENTRDRKRERETERGKQIHQSYTISHDIAILFSNVLTTLHASVASHQFFICS